MAPTDTGFMHALGKGSLRFVRRVMHTALLGLIVGSTFLPLSAQSAVIGTQQVQSGARVELLVQAPDARSIHERAEQVLRQKKTAWQTKNTTHAELRSLKRQIERAAQDVSFFESIVGSPVLETAKDSSVPPGLEKFGALLLEPSDDAAQLQLAKEKHAKLVAQLPAAEAAESAANNAWLALEVEIDSLDQEAMPLLLNLDLSAQVRRSIDRGSMTLPAGSIARGTHLLEIWSAQHDRPLSELTPAEVYAFLAADRPGFAKELQSLPPEIFASPYDVLYAGTSKTMSSVGVQRAQSLADFGYQPMSKDVLTIARLGDQDFETVKAFVGSLAKAGLQFERDYHGGGPFQGELSGELTQLINQLDWKTPKGRAATLKAVAELKANGGTVTPAEARLLSVMANSKEAGASKRASLLLSRVAPPSARWDADYVALVSKRTERFGDDAELVRTLDLANEKMGRKLTAPEAAVLLEAVQHGASVESIILNGVAGLSEAGLEDIATLIHAPERYQRQTTEALRDSLDARIGEITPRLDSNAEYVETSSASFARPKLIKMHMLLDALAQPTTRQALIDALESDMTDGAREQGGALSIDKSGLPVFDLYPSAHTNEHAAAYLLPSDVEPLKAFGLFHFHAVSTVGEPDRSGPSSASQGQEADIAAAYLYHQDSIVVSATEVDESGKVIRFNVDFASPDGQVRDLGMFSGTR